MGGSSQPSSESSRRFQSIFGRRFSVSLKYKANKCPNQENASGYPSYPTAPDALAVLECVRELVETFLQSDAPEPAKATIVTLVRDCQDLSA